MPACPRACTFGHMLLRSFKFTVLLILLAHISFAQAKGTTNESASNKIYFEFKPTSGVLINAGLKDTAFYDLDEALGINLKYALFYCKVTEGSVTVSMPYASHSFSRSVNREHPGIKFSSNVFTCDVVPAGNSGYKVTLQTKDLGSDNYVMSLIVKGKEAFCLLKNSSKGIIGFFGKVKKL